MPLRKGWRKVREWFVHLLHLDDSAHRIALGVAIGTFVAVTPTWGIQMVLVVALAWLCRANKVAGLPMVWVTNPATNVPIYSFCYVIGQALVGGPGLEEVKQALAAAQNPDLTWGGLFRLWGALMYHAALPLWVGTCIVGAVAGIILYGLMYYLITFYRRRHLHHPGGTVAAPDASAAAGGVAPDGTTGSEAP